MTVYIEKPAVNLREELASLRNQGGYSEQQFYFDSLVTNGTFDADTAWTKGTGWTIGSGVASHGSGVESNLDQTVDAVTGKAYQVSFTVSGRTTGAVQIFLRGGFTTSIAADGSYSQVVVAGSASSYSLRVVGSSTFDGSIDNISIFEVDASNDVVHRMPKGWKPKDVFEDGLLQREGAAHDYEVVYDGFDYFVKPAVAPSATTQTCVIGVKA